MDTHGLVVDKLRRAQTTNNQKSTRVQIKEAIPFNLTLPGALVVAHVGTVVPLEDNGVPHWVPL